MPEWNLVPPLTFAIGSWLRCLNRQTKSKAHQPCSKVTRLHSLIASPAIVASRAPSYQIRGMSNHPSDEWVSHRYLVANLRFQARLKGSKMPFQQFHTNLCAPVRLRIVLGRVLLEALVKSLDSKFAEGLSQQSNNRVPITIFRTILT